MGIIKERFKAKADAANIEIKDLLKEHGNRKAGEVTLSQIYQGMRGITGLVTETSLLDAQEGIRFRGYSIPELQVKLPTAKPGGEPMPEGLFYLMLGGELPTEEDAHHITNVWQRRSFTSAIISTSGNMNMYLYPGACGGQRLADSGTIYYRNPKVEITNVDTGNSTFNSTSNIGLWYDLSGNGRNGTLNGPTSNVSNKGNILFNGSSDYINGIGSSIVPTSTAPYTVSVWCYRNTNNSSYKELLAQWTSANSGNSFFFGFQNSDVRFTDNWNPITVAGAGNTNVWMNLVGVYTVSNAFIYLNGVLAATKGSGFTYTGTGPLIIGRQGELNGEYFDGRISNVLVYNRALTAAEISQNYEADKSKFGL